MEETICYREDGKLKFRPTSNDVTIAFVVRYIGNIAVNLEESYSVNKELIFNFN